MINAPKVVCSIGGTLSKPACVLNHLMLDAMTGFDERAGAPTRPHQLSNPTYGPEEIKMLGEAFDAAWERVAPGLGDLSP